MGRLLGGTTRLNLAWIAAWGILGSALIVSASSRLSATFDEPFYLRAGLQHWRTGSTWELMRFGTMPLPLDVQAAPLRAAEIIRGRPWDLDAEFDQALAIARLGNLAFWWLMLIYGGLLARQLGGPWAGRLAVTVLALEPNLAAHAGLATTDVAVTACLLMFAFHYRNGRERGWGWRVGLPALCCGLALLAKASTLVFAPICIVAIETERHWRQSSQTGSWRRAIDTFRGLTARSFLGEFLVTGLIALLIAYLYCGSDWQVHPQLVADAHALQDGPLRTPAIWAAEHLRIFNNAGVGLWYQVTHNLRGHGTFLLGETAPTAIWYYFPVALAMKLPLPLHAAPLLLLAFARRLLANWASFAALLLFAFSLNCRVQIGIRLQLPLIALATIGLAASAARAISESRLPSRRIAVATAGACIVWIGVSSASYWPNGLSYFNECWPGRDHGEELLSDSNFDWGQGLKELDRWRRAKGLLEIDVWYFGTDPAASKPPFRSIPLHSLTISDERDLARHVSGRYLAVGATILHGNCPEQPAWLLDRLRQMQPADRTRTFLIFDLSELNSPSQGAVAVKPDRTPPVNR